jgi:catechol-2,3-dioxygenase
MDGPVDAPLLDLKFLSHGTLLMEEMGPTRRFYEEFLGIEVVETSPKSLAIRLNSDTCVACVERGKLVKKPGREYLRYYNIGIGLGDAADVARARGLALEHRDAYGLREISETEDENGRVSFLIEDRDGNFWQIMNEAPAH